MKSLYSRIYIPYTYKLPREAEFSLLCQIDSLIRSSLRKYFQCFSVDWSRTTQINRMICDQLDEEFVSNNSERTHRFVSLSLMLHEEFE